MSNEQKIELKVPDDAVVSMGVNLPDYEKGFAQSIPVKVESRHRGLDIIVEGYGMKTMASGEGPIVTLEHYEGKLQLLVWADINSEDPTHTINLEGAREILRKPE